MGARVCNRHPQNMIPTLKNEISFKITPLLLLFPLLEQVYQERALENNKKRVVFYIQINLYFCHKTLKVNRRFSTKSFVKDPQNTLSPLRTGLQDTGLFYNLVIIFFGLFFPPFPYTFNFQEQFCTGAQENKSVRDLTPKAGVSCPLESICQSNNNNNRRLAIENPPTNI